MPEPDYEGYAKSLEKILDVVTNDYCASYIEFNRHQLIFSKTYLFVSSALLCGYAGVFHMFQFQLTGNSCLLLFGSIAFALGCFAFGICLYAIPARNGYRTIPNSGWGEFSSEAYKLLSENNQKVYASFLTSLISKIDKSFEHNFFTNQRRAKLLRFTSWLLVSSFSFAFFVFASAAIESLLTPKNLSEVISMTKDNVNNQTPAPAPASVPPLQVPVPPPSANIGGNASTHTMDGVTSKTFSTESLKVDK